MRRSRALARIRAGEPVRICSLGHFVPSYVRHAAHFGFDCIWVDQEHRAMDPSLLQSLLTLFHKCDIDCLLRPPTRERNRLYRYLEDGATGLMIPHVSTPEIAQALVQATRFPPLGDRGLDGAGFDSDYYLDGGADYPQRANEETMLVVQIETPQAVANVDAIAAVPGVDGLFVGPGDLGLRLKHDSTGMTMDDAFAHVAQAAARHGKAWGCPCATVAELRARRDQGAQLLAHGGDFMALMQMLQHWQDEFDQAFSESAGVESADEA